MVFLVGALFVPSTLHAQSCDSAGSFTSELWLKYIELAREAGCLAPVQGPRKTLACAISAPAQVAGLADQVVGWWNAVIGRGGWGTFGPRRLGPTPQVGTLWGTSGRLWLGSAPVHSKTTVRVDKLDGRAPTEVLVCATGEDGSPRVLARHRFEKGPGRAAPFEREFDLAAEIVSVKVDAKDFVPTNRFKYEIKLTTEPIKYDYGPVEGFADLHVHQAAELGFGGNNIWGSHIGPPSEALAAHDPSETAEEEVVLGPVQWALGLHSLPGVMLKEGETRHGPGYPSFERWPHFNDVTHQQVHEDWLKEAHDGGLNLIVVSAVNFEGFCYALKAMYPKPGDRMGCRDMENVERQIRALIEMDERRDWYEIAVHPWHARKIIHEGNLAVVISMEVSHLFPPQGHFVTQLDRLWGMGLRTLQLAHETDSHFAGAAPHRSVFEAFQALKWGGATAGGPPPSDDDEDGWIWAWHGAGFSYDEDGKNSVGLSRQGVELAEAMVDRHMLFDVAHLSERAMYDLYQFVANRHDHYPLYDSHTRFQPILTDDDRETQREFVTTDEQIRYIRETGGMVGLRTGQNAILTAASEDDPGVVNDCDGSSKSFAQLVHYGKRAGLQMGLGSDFNGFINQLGPRYDDEACPRAGVRLTFEDEEGKPITDGEETSITDEEGDPVADPRQKAETVAKEQRDRQSDAPSAQCEAPDGASGTGRDFDTEGLRHVGYLPDLISDLEALETPGVEVLKSSAEAFLQMWERSYDPDRGKVEEGTDLAQQVVDAVGPWSPCGSQVQSLGVLAFVAGDWVRVGGNNPRNDGMRIRVEGSRATVTAMPPSGSNRFGVGMVLWDDIRDDGTVQVQGSDRRLYDAELTMEGENRLQIDVDHFGPGYEQTWERTGPAIDGDWVLVAADEDGSAGTRIRVEGDRATLLYVPPAAPRGYRTGGVLWQEIGAGDRRGLGRLEALSGGRSYTPAQYRLRGDDRLRLVRDADGSVELWARPGVAEELLAQGAGGDLSAAPELDPEVPGDPTDRTETLRRLDETPTLDMHLVSAARKHPAAVVGLVFHDLDGNGTYDDGEPGLAGVTIRVVDSASDDLTTVTTDRDGLYRFESERGVSHRISVEAASLPFSGKLTTHPPEYEVEVRRGFTAPNINFGYRER